MWGILVYFFLDRETLVIAPRQKRRERPRLLEELTRFDNAPFFGGGGRGCGAQVATRWSLSALNYQKLKNNKRRIK